jgi:hypothetical protein
MIYSIHVTLPGLLFDGVAVIRSKVLTRWYALLLWSQSLSSRRVMVGSMAAAASTL